MRIAAITDIHGNLPALEAVLDDIARDRVSQSQLDWIASWPIACRPAPGVLLFHATTGRPG